MCGVEQDLMIEPGCATLVLQNNSQNPVTLRGLYIQCEGTGQTEDLLSGELVLEKGKPVEINVTRDVLKLYDDFLSGQHSHGTPASGGPPVHFSVWPFLGPGHVCACKPKLIPRSKLDSLRDR